MLESLDECHVFVERKHFLVLLQKLAELLHLALLDTVENLKVRREWLHEIFTAENALVGYFTHQESYDDKKFCCCNTETESTNLRSFPQSLIQACLCSRVF